MTTVFESLVFPETGLEERLGPPATLDRAQREAADELINGPRGGVYGPFRPLLQTPALLKAVAKVGESLRYEGQLSAPLREWTICVVARELSNVFEWETHLPLAKAAGVPEQALKALEARESLPLQTPAELALAQAVALELIRSYRVTDETYAEALRCWGEPGVVEFLILVGYFTTVCGLMNVARTSGPM